MSSRKKKAARWQSQRDRNEPAVAEDILLRIGQDLRSHRDLLLGRSSSGILAAREESKERKDQ